ncbi:MAG: GAF domain-containing protein [Chloroflexi bacterium]|nr:GAF domain-containing protein [Chloroflexota bacterium]
MSKTIPAPVSHDPFHQPSNAAPDDQPGPAERRILYLEDDPGAARLVQKRLERAGYTVDLAYESETGLAMYNAGSYDIVAVDQNLPIHDGLEVIRIMTAGGTPPPIVMITGTGSEKIAVAAMKLGAADYIVKDVDGVYLELLPTVIEQAVQRQRLVEESRQAEEERHRRLLRVQGQQQAIVRLATHEALRLGDFAAAARATTETAAEVMDVARVGLWLLNDDATELRCVDLFERPAMAHSGGQVLQAKRYPRYFEHLETGRSVDAHDASADPRTSEFHEDYLRPLGITATLDAPVRVSGRLVGVVCHEHVGLPRRWSEDEVSFASAVADQVAQAILNSERKRVEDRLATVQALGQQLVLSRDVAAIAQSVVEAAGQVLRVPICALWLVDVEQKALVCWAVRAGPDVPFISTLPLDGERGVIVAAVRAGSMVYLPDVRQDPRYIGDSRVRSELCIPIQADGRVIGVLNAESEQLDAFTPADQQLLAALANAAAIALENARLIDSLAQEKGRLELLYRLSRKLAASLDVYDLAQRALDDICVGVGASRGAIFVRASDSDRLPPVAISGYNAESVQEVGVRLSLRLGEGLAGWVAAHRQPMLVADVTQDERWFFLPGLDDWVRSALIVPLTSGDELVGVLSLYADQPGFFTAEHRRLTESVAAGVAVALANARLFAQVERSERLYRTILENSADAIISVDPDLKVMAWSAGAERILGYARDEIIGQTMRILIPEPDRQQTIAMLHEARQQGFAQSRETRRRAKDGRLVDVEATVTDLGPVLGFTTILRDVTERNRLEAQLRQQERLAAVGQLSAGIAHDFNNILTGIIGLAQMLQMSAAVPDSAKADLARIAQGGQRAAHLVRQLLDFSRKSIRTPLRLDLASFLQDAGRFLERTIPENVSVTLEIAPGEYPVTADPVQIQQVLTNLATNARDAMPEGGELRVRLSRLTLSPGDQPPIPDMPPGEWVALAVADTGTGIPPEVRPHIFEPFFTTKEVGQGTGLGLAQVYGIVRQHAGYIDLETQEGAGTTFTIYLPAAGRSAEMSPPAATEDPPVGQGELILVVEDEPLVLEVIQAQLQQWGYQVVPALNGQEALAVFDQHRTKIALVLSDMVMPGLSGPALIQALRAQAPALRAIMVTGYPLGAELEQSLTLEGTLWVQKPIEGVQLARMVRQALTS